MDRYQTFTLLINRISKCIQKIKTEEMTHYDLKSVHVSCLYALYESDQPLTSRELSKHCGVDKALISRSLEELESKGFITCESSKEKRYRSPIQLTEKGTELGKYIHYRIDDLLEEASRGLTKEQRENLYEGLDLISNNLENIVSAKERKND